MITHSDELYRDLSRSLSSLVKVNERISQLETMVYNILMHGYQLSLAKIFEIYRRARTNSKKAAHCVKIVSDFSPSSDVQVELDGEIITIHQKIVPFGKIQYAQLDNYLKLYFEKTKDKDVAIMHKELMLFLDPNNQYNYPHPD